MPVVQVNVMAGMSQENKKKIVDGITQVFEGIGIPGQATTVMIVELPRENWGSGGKLHSESPLPPRNQPKPA